QMGGFDPSSHGSHGSMAHKPAAIVAQAPTENATPVAGDVPGLVPESGDIPGAPRFQPKYGFGATPEEGSRAPDLTVNVTGIQFAWLFNYPDSGITSGELHVPVGKDVQLNLTAQDVIHSFWVPQFRLKQDAIPGQNSELRFVATKVGTYPVVCAELCGSYHGGMRTQVVVQTPEEYDQWVQQNTTTAQAPAQPIAVSPADLTDSEYLSPYSQELGVKAETVAQLHSMNQATP
ncbi:MAG TPA: cytochrome c oxidase subunit II, partial [Allocoleopsis sp.]